MRAKNIALLVFALSPEEEVKNKPFSAKADLAKSLNRHTHNIAINSGLPIRTFDESRQVGTDFGTRFSNAIKQVYDEGYDAVITIGNDCPQLQVNHILAAQQALANKQTVVGPTHDGGFYLLGISKDDFDYDTFLNFSWKTEKVFEEVIAGITADTEAIFRLEKLRDINYFSDLQKLSLQRIQNAQLKGIVRSLAAGYALYFFRDTHHKLELLRSTAYNKGSPCPNFA